MEEGTPPRRKQDDDPRSEAREHVRQMRANVERNKGLLAHTRELIQRLAELLTGKGST